MSTIAPSLEGAVAEATILVREIDVLDLRAAPSMWRLADLTAANTYEKGRPPKIGNRLPISEWAEKIGWAALGREEDTLGQMAKLARQWPEEYRVEYRKTKDKQSKTVEEGVSFWQHREALTHFGNIEAASEWLASHDRPRSVRDATRSGILGTGPIFDAIRALVRARKAIVRVPAILADADALGTEPNFDQLRAEVARLKKGMAYLDRYLADEITIDLDELQAGLDKILKEAS